MTRVHDTEDGLIVEVEIRLSVKGYKLQWN